MTRVQFLARAGERFFISTTMFRATVGPTQPPIQWVLGALSCGHKVARA